MRLESKKKKTNILLNHLVTPEHSIQNYWPEKKKNQTKEDLHRSVLSAIYAAEPWLVLKLLPQTDTSASLNANTQLPTDLSSKTAISWRNSSAPTPVEAQKQNELLQQGLWLIYPGPRPPPFPRSPGKGAGQTTRRHKGGRRSSRECSPLPSVCGMQSAEQRKQPLLETAIPALLLQLHLHCISNVTG